MKHSPTDVAKWFDFIRETEQNKGFMVEAIQHWSGGMPGQSWCAYFILFILDICFGGKEFNPIKRSGAVQDIYEQAIANGWMVDRPQKDDLYIFINDVGHAHHIGIVTADTLPTDQTFPGFAGNTSADGKSSNGDRAAEHDIEFGPHTKFIRFPK